MLCYTVLFKKANFTFKINLLIQICFVHHMCMCVQIGNGVCSLLDYDKIKIDKCLKIERIESDIGFLNVDSTY